uniref:DBD_Tnp_Mut domain-containing protein n=1 Tax=Panagrellus redivivus TaxID=6233 RepID=A0A7E4UMM9_PANRE
MSNPPHFPASVNPARERQPATLDDGKVSAPPIAWHDDLPLILPNNVYIAQTSRNQPINNTSASSIHVHPPMVDVDATPTIEDPIEYTDSDSDSDSDYLFQAFDIRPDTRSMTQCEPLNSKRYAEFNLTAMEFHLQFRYDNKQTGAFSFRKADKHLKFEPQPSGAMKVIYGASGFDDEMWPKMRWIDAFRAIRARCDRFFGRFPFIDLTGD